MSIKTLSSFTVSAETVCLYRFRALKDIAKFIDFIKKDAKKDRALFNKMLSSIENPDSNSSADDVISILGHFHVRKDALNSLDNILHYQFKTDNEKLLGKTNELATLSIAMYDLRKSLDVRYSKVVSRLQEIEFPSNIKNSFNKVIEGKEIACLSPVINYITDVNSSGEPIYSCVLKFVGKNISDKRSNYYLTLSTYGDVMYENHSYGLVPPSLLILSKRYSSNTVDSFSANGFKPGKSS